MSNAQAPAGPTPVQVALMPWPQRKAHMASMTPAQRTAVHAAIARQNATYMQHTHPQIAPVPAAGSALTQAWAAGAQLTFNVNTAQNSFLEGYMIRFVGTGTLAAGASAVYAKNAAFPFNLIDNVQVIYGNVVQNYRPYVLRALAMMQGQMAPPQPSTVLVGQSVASVSTYLNSTQPITAGSANTWDYELYVPMAPIRPMDWHGMVPIMQGETQCQIIITCATSAAVGVDPVLAPLAIVSGTGHVVTVAANFSIFARYRDGRVHHTPHLMRFDVAGESMAQFMRDQTLTGIAAGSVYRGTIGIRSSAIWWVILTVIDGNQSNKFSAVSNWQVIGEYLDSVGNNPMWQMGTGTNVNLYENFFRMRQSFWQDAADEGIWPIIRGPTENITDPSNMNGVVHLSTAPGGLPDWRYGIQLGSIAGVGGITPRIDSHVIFAGGVLQ